MQLLKQQAAQEIAAANKNAADALAKVAQQAQDLQKKEGENNQLQLRVGTVQQAIQTLEHRILQYEQQDKAYTQAQHMSEKHLQELQEKCQETQQAYQQQEQDAREEARRWKASVATAETMAEERHGETLAKPR